MENSSKLRLLFIQQMLLKYSSEENPLNSNDLTTLCESQGFKVERKAIYRDIEALEKSGMDLIFTRLPKQGWFVASRLFENAELKILIDAVQASSFIPSSKSNLLIEKLTALSSEDQARKLTRNIVYPKNKVKNEQILYLVDQIHEAIESNASIEFYYFDITVNKQKKYRYQKKRYSLIPYAMIWENQRYYCIGYDEKHKNFSHYRIDKMESVTSSSYPVEKKPFDLQEYISHVFGMFQGPTKTIALQVDNALASVFFDQFGQDVLISEVNEQTFTVHLALGTSSLLIGWLMQFKNRIKVLSPQSFIDEIKETAQTVLSLYNSNS